MPSGGLPVVADTDGDGRDTVSIARFGRLYVMDGLGGGPASLEGAASPPVSQPAAAWRSESPLSGGGAGGASLEYGSTGMLPVAGRFGELPGDDDAPPYRSGGPALSRGDEGPAAGGL